MAGNFWWRQSIQQIHFRGFASSASEEKSTRLFEMRSRSARAVALSSLQSQPLKSESDLKTRFEALSLSTQPLLRPSTWNAYEIIPIEYEFWQGDATRLHKRLRYSLQIPSIDFSKVSNLNELELTQGKWIQQRLQP